MASRAGNPTLTASGSPGHVRVGTRNAAEAAKQVSDAARHRDRAYRDVQALIDRRR